MSLSQKLFSKDNFDSMRKSFKEAFGQAERPVEENAETPAKKPVDPTQSLDVWGEDKPNEAESTIKKDPEE